MQHIQTRYGTLAAPDDSEDEIISFLRDQGEWAWLESKAVASMLPDTRNVIDAGAFLGTFSLGLGLLLELESVCAIEANPELGPLTRDNLDRLLPNTRTTLIEAALLPSKDIQAVGHASSANLGSLSFAEQTTDQLEASDVEIVARDTTTLDSVLAKYPFDLVKLDLEGLEGAVLRGCVNLATIPSLWIECNESISSIAVGEHLLEEGFRLHFVSWRACNPETYRKGKRRYPFAHEAALCATRPEVAVQDLEDHSASQFIFSRAINSIEELRGALWQTPRWSPPHWSAVTAEEALGEATHELAGLSRDRFMSESHSDELEMRTGQSTWELVIRDMQQLRHSLDRALGEDVGHEFRARMGDLCRHVSQLKVELQLQARRASIAERAIEIHTELHSITPSTNGGSS